MRHTLNFRQKIGVMLERAGRSIQKHAGGVLSVQHQLVYRNRFDVAVVRDGEIISRTFGWNDVTAIGKTTNLDVMFHNATQIHPWYIGLINNTPTPVLSENDTSSSHSGWVEFTGYTGNRQEWDEAAAAAKAITSATTSDFPITSAATIYGIFIDSLATTTAGTLWATGGFDASQAVVSGDTLKITYGLSL
jgi:hypothetical protein